MKRILVAALATIMCGCSLGAPGESATVRLTVIEGEIVSVTFSPGLESFTVDLGPGESESFDVQPGETAVVAAAIVPGFDGLAVQSVSVHVRLTAGETRDVFFDGMMLY